MTAIIEATTTNPRKRTEHSEHSKHVLELLTVRESMKLCEVARALRCPTNTALMVLTRLEEKCCVRRVMPGPRGPGHHGPSVWSLRHHAPSSHPFR